MAVSVILSLIASAWLYILYWGTGVTLTRIFRVERHGTLLAFLIECGLGFCFIGNCIMALCFLHQASPVILRSFLVLLSAAVSPCVIIECKELKYLFLKVRSWMRESNPFLFWPAFLLIVLYGVLCLLPSTGFDSLMYHLATVKLYLQKNGFWNIYFNPQADFPMLCEMHYMVGLSLGNDHLCKGIAYFAALTALCGVVLTARSLRLSINYTMLSLLAFLTSTAVIANLPDCDVDLAMASWMVLAIFCFEKFLHANDKKMFIVSLLFAGMAIETKIFGIFILPVLLTRYIWARKASGFSPREHIYALIIVLIPLLFGIPWYIKASINRGTILSIQRQVIIGQGLSTPLGLTHPAGVLHYHIVNSIVRVITAPWSFSLFPAQHQGDTFGPLLLAVLPFLIFIPRLKQSFVFITMIVYFCEILFMEMIFIQGGSSIRYSFILLMMGIPLVCRVISLLESRYIKKLFLVLVVLQIVLGYGLFIKRYH
jgi:hypothetical protein